MRTTSHMHVFQFNYANTNLNNLNCIMLLKITIECVLLIYCAQAFKSFQSFIEVRKRRKPISIHTHYNAQIEKYNFIKIHFNSGSNSLLLYTTKVIELNFNSSSK